MLQKTLDLIDSELKREHAVWRGQTALQRYPHYLRSIHADPVQWQLLHQYFSKHKFKWTEFQYKDVMDANDLDSKIPSTSPGVYIFYVKADQLVFEFPRIALYCGISNDQNSNRPIRERLKDYYYLSVKDKRGNEDLMLQLYYPYIWVTYTLLNWATPEIKELETNLHEYLGPPFSSQAYMPETRRVRNAWDH